MNKLILEKINNKITKENKKIILNLRSYINQYNNMEEKPHKDFFFRNMPKKIKKQLRLPTNNHAFIIGRSLINKKFYIKLQVIEEEGFFNLLISYCFRKELEINNFRYFLKVEIKEENTDLIWLLRGNIKDMSNKALDSFIREISYNFNSKKITDSHFVTIASEGFRFNKEAILTTFDNVYSTNEELKDILALKHDLNENIFPYLTINKILNYILNEKKETIKLKKSPNLFNIIKEKIIKYFNV